MHSARRTSINHKAFLQLGSYKSEVMERTNGKVVGNLIDEIVGK